MLFRAQGNQSLRFTVVCFYLIFGIGVASTLAANQAPEAPTLCDELAANPSDPDRVAKGVGFEEIDPVAALAACKDAIDKWSNSPRFLYQLGRAHDRSDEMSDAIKRYEDAAALEYPYALYVLGYVYEDGDGATPDIDKAIGWYVKGAEAGVLNAYTRLIAIYGEEASVRYDEAEAVHWLSRGAETGNPAMQYYYGKLLGAGSERTPPSPEGAVKWYEKASGQGHVEAQHDLALLLKDGDAVAKDLERARELLEVSFNGGYLRAAYELSNTFSRISDESVHWLRLAATNRVKIAQRSLGYAYSYGHGVDKNAALSRCWLRKASAFDTTIPVLDQSDVSFIETAASAGYAGAQLTLAQMYNEGTYVELDKYEAFVWASTARDIGGLDEEHVKIDAKLIASTGPELGVDRLWEAVDEIKKRAANTIMAPDFPCE